jgi:hydroxyacylglutathione hydrolase
MSNYKIGKLTIGMYQTNCYFLYDIDEKKAIVFDPADNGKYIYDTLLKHELTVSAICLTHGHFDHIWGAEELRTLSQVKLYGPEAERVLFEDAKVNVSAQVGRPYTIRLDEYLKDQDILEIEGIKLKMIHTPGHTIGSSCYYVEEAGILISGDTLFEGSVGRTDLPTGSMSMLNRSIKEKLLILPDETKVYPGHGDSTTIDMERKYNPYCS